MIINTTKSTAESTTESGVKVAYGSYKGSGTYGEYNSNYLMFEFSPSLVIVQNADVDSTTNRDILIMLNSSMPIHIKISRDDFSVSGPEVYGFWEINSPNDVLWYSETAADQLNIKNCRYTYFAIGTGIG